jgi:hypothetical protein
VAIDEDLELLDRSIKRLNIEWDKFFGGVERRPPNEMQAKVEALVRKYAYAEMRNMTERFRYQTLTARFNTFNELWGKKLRAREEGHAVGVHGLKALMPPPPEADPDPAEAAAAFAAAQRAAAAAAAPAAEIRVRSAEEAGVRALFDQFAAARQTLGEPPVKFEAFQKLIAQQATRIISEKGAAAVSFRVETKDGKVALKAKPVR